MDGISKPFAVLETSSMAEIFGGFPLVFTAT
jgi:hypothetical protein